MAWSFTAAAERALAEAAGWTSRTDRDELDAPELLLGLLAEPESRAAELLNSHGVDAAAVQQRWPSLVRAKNGRRREFSHDVLAALTAAIDRLWEYPRPLTLATEHVLLGLAAATGDTATWLATHEMSADQLELEIHRHYGHEPGPLPIEPVDEANLSPPAVPIVTAPSVFPTTPGAAMAVDQKPADVPEGAKPYVAGAASAAVPLLRVLDAAANRAREGLRVVEDYVRMVLDDRFLTSELKRVRHDLQTALQPLDGSDLLAARETQTDVGRTASTSTEFARFDLAAVAAANWKRLEEALRTLEEFTKIEQPAIARAVETIRYRTYTLERAAEVTSTSLVRLATTRLCVLVDGRASQTKFEHLLDALVCGGVGMIQLRDKKLQDRELLERARLLQARTSASGVISIINDRADIAATVHADGVHVGQDDLPVKAARTIVGPRALVGVSTHSIEQARQAVLDGANYIGVGPTFPSTTKSFDKFTGVDLLQAVAAEIRLPAFAIGGVNLDNLAAVIGAGFSRVATSGAIVNATDPGAAAGEFMRRLLDPTQCAMPHG